MSRPRVGRPYRDDLALVEDIVDVLRVEPDASSRRVQALVCARRSDVLRALRSLRRLECNAEVVPTVRPGSAIRSELRSAP
jgi:hypothetical protein